MPVAVDGIAYSPVDDLLYWKPVTRSSLFSTPGQTLRAAHGASKGVALDMTAGNASVVEYMGYGFHDGLDAGQHGEVGCSGPWGQRNGAQRGVNRTPEPNPSPNQYPAPASILGLNPISPMNATPKP